MIGSVTLTLLGRERVIQGGPFDDFQPPAIGVCLEMRSAKIAEAALVLPVADFAAPSAAVLAAAMRDLIGLMVAAPDLPVYIGCRAGIGRTGMLIATLAKLAGESDPVGWVRVHYHQDAVETLAQSAAVAAFDVASIRVAGLTWRHALFLDGGDCHG